MPDVSYPQLRVRSDLSLSMGASKVEDLLAVAKQQMVPAVALANRGAMFDVLDFSELAAGKGIQPIVALEISVEVPDVGQGLLLLLATSETGYISLCRILKESYEPSLVGRGQPKVPEERKVSIDAIRRFSDGVIALGGGGSHKGEGLLPMAARRSEELLSLTYRHLLRIFGDRFYVEVCRNAPSARGSLVEKRLLQAADGQFGDVDCADGITRSRAALVATTDVWYARDSDFQAWAMLTAIADKQQLQVAGDKLVHDAGIRHHLRDRESFAALFDDLPDALENTNQVAMRCAFRPQKREPILPPFASENGLSEAEEMAKQAREGLDARMNKMGADPEKRALYSERLEYELGVIIRMGFPGYFLIVADFIKWAKAQDIPVGPGRGSGAGSVVAWALTITNLDPIGFGLLFERFLNPDRVSMPDFDIDFCRDRRGEVITYVQDKYGDEAVTMIVTFGKILAKTAIRDSARIIDDTSAGHFSFREVNEVIALLPTKAAEQKKTLREVEKESEQLRTLLTNSPKMGSLVNHARRIEGLYRQSSTHAAGVIIGDRPQVELYPVIRDAETGIQVCALAQKGAENAGAVKFDFLGLKNLSIIKRAIDFVAQFEGVHLDIDAIPVDDAAVYRAFAEGRTTGVFQMASEGMRNALRLVRPTRLEDITAINALYRPGPMAYIPSYAARKAGTEPVVYPQPASKTQPFLEETYGYMVYQEQVMQVAQVCAGYSLGQADLLRRAMGKKIAAEMAVQRSVFVHGNERTPGAVKLGMTVATAEALFDDIAKFADYGFNKSHAAAYAVIAYQTMWLKANYPAAFYASLLSYEDKADIRARIKEEMLREDGIELLLPDINRSGFSFLPERRDDGTLAVRFGLAAISDVSESLAFLEERAKRPFRSLPDIHERVGRILSKGAKESLSAAGAFDSLESCRARCCGTLLWLAEKSTKPNTAQQTFLEALGSETIVPDDIAKRSEWPDRAAREFKAFGFFVSQHPIDEFRSRLGKVGVKRRVSYDNYMRSKKVGVLWDRKLCVMVDDYEVTTGKKSARQFLRLNCSEREDSYVILFFPSGGKDEHIAAFADILKTAKQQMAPVVITCNVSLDDDRYGLSIRGSKVELATDFLEGVQDDVVLRLAPEVDPEQFMATIMPQLAEHNSNAIGDAKVILDGRNGILQLPGTFRLSPLHHQFFADQAGVAGVGIVREAMTTGGSHPAESEEDPFADYGEVLYAMES